MGPSRTNSTSTQNPAKKEEGSIHLVECTGPGVDESGCVIWNNTFVPTLIPKNFFSRPFLCGFCERDDFNFFSISTFESLWVEFGCKFSENCQTNILSNITYNPLKKYQIDFLEQLMTNLIMHLVSHSWDLFLWVTITWIISLRLKKKIWTQ